MIKYASTIRHDEKLIGILETYSDGTDGPSVQIPLSLQDHLDLALLDTTGDSPSLVQYIREEAAATTGDTVRALNLSFGLTWQEIANLFGVSRRTAHNWANGTPLRARNQQRLDLAFGGLAPLHVGSPQETRAVIMAPDEGGTSPYRRLMNDLRRDGLIGRSDSDFDT